MSNNYRVPDVRFHGYKSNWEERAMGEITTRVRGNDGRLDIPTLTISAINGWMDQRDRFYGNIAGKEQKNYTLLKKGELSYNKGNSKYAKYGVVYELTSFNEGLVPKVYHSFSANIGTISTFIEYYFLTKKPDKQLSEYVTTTARMDGLLNISYDDFMKVTIRQPQQDEQEHVSKLFRAIDDRIKIYENYLNKITNYKQSMLQKMFPKEGETVPEVRFEGFDGEWENCKLRDIAVVNPKTTLPMEFRYVDLESVIGTEMLSYKQEKREQAPSRAQRLAEKGDVFYQTVRPYQKNNYLFDLSDNDYVFSTGYAQLRPYGDSYFLLSSLQEEQFVSNVLDRCTGTSYPAINSNDLSRIEIRVPSNNLEQKQIGNLFKFLDKAINLRQKKLRKLKQFKQAMLDKMFV